MSTEVLYGIFIGLLLLWNLVALLITAYDKRAAKKHRRRVPEKVFLQFAATLGGAGVLAAFYICRHKTRHLALLSKMWIITVLVYGVLAVAVYIF